MKAVPDWHDSTPDAVPLALARHHAILHEAIMAHNGHVFLIVGDEFEVAFTVAQDGLAAAHNAQALCKIVDM